MYLLWGLVRKVGETLINICQYFGLARINRGEAAWWVEENCSNFWTIISTLFVQFWDGNCRNTFFSHNFGKYVWNFSDFSYGISYLLFISVIHGYSLIIDCMMIHYIAFLLFEFGLFRNSEFWKHMRKSETSYAIFFQDFK